MGLFGADAAAVLRDAGLGPAHVIGHSMGGRVAQELVLAEPALVRSIVLAASGAGTPHPIPYARVGIPLGVAVPMMTAGYERFIRDKHRSSFFTAAFAAEHPDEVEWLDDAYLAGKPDVEDYLKHVRARQAFSSVDRFGTIEAPVMIVVGARDLHDGGTGSHLAQSRRLHELLPSARFELIEGARHGFLWEDVDRSLALIADFLRDVESRGLTPG